jgi:hypothetical protein
MALKGEAYRLFSIAEVDKYFDIRRYITLITLCNEQDLA